MPKIVITPQALDDLIRLRKFLLEKDETAADKAKRVLVAAIDRLAQNPYLGRVLEDDLRALTVSFGKYGYQVAYRHDEERVYILAIRGGREESFRAL
jgi:plasmid stabilization system protein ParE